MARDPHLPRPRENPPSARAAPSAAARVRAEPDRGQRGTTLVELLIGLVILMILGAMSVPGTAGMVRAYNVRAAADELVFAADFARSQAMANRRAYGIRFVQPQVGGRFAFSVVQGTGASCATLAAGQVVRTVDRGPNNATNEPAIVISAVAPSDLTNALALPCFKPDGRVLRADNGQPFSAPLGSTLGGGEIVVEVQRAEGATLLGAPLQVQIGYNGSARVVFGRPTSLLQGSGQGGAP